MFIQYDACFLHMKKMKSKKHMKEQNVKEKEKIKMTEIKNSWCTINLNQNRSIY